MGRMKRRRKRLADTLAFGSRPRRWIHTILTSASRTSLRRWIPVSLTTLDNLQYPSALAPRRCARLTRLTTMTTASLWRRHWQTVLPRPTPSSCTSRCGRNTGATRLMRSLTPMRCTSSSTKVFGLLLGTQANRTTTRRLLCGSFWTARPGLESSSQTHLPCSLPRRSHPWCLRTQSQSTLPSARSRRSKWRITLSERRSTLRLQRRHLDQFLVTKRTKRVVGNHPPSQNYIITSHQSSRVLNE